MFNSDLQCRIMEGSRDVPTRQKISDCPNTSAVNSEQLQLPGTPARGAPGRPLHTIGVGLFSIPWSRRPPGDPDKAVDKRRQLSARAQCTPDTRQHTAPWMGHVTTRHASGRESQRAAPGWNVPVGPSVPVRVDELL